MLSVVVCYCGCKGRDNHSECVLPEAARSRSSLKETLFLSMAASDWAISEGGGVELLGVPSDPEGRSLIGEGRGAESEERVGELGERKKVARDRRTPDGKTRRTRERRRGHDEDRGEEDMMNRQEHRKGETRERGRNRN